MPAIITDQIRVLNAANFVSGVTTTSSNYYVFLGLPNATEVAVDWNSNTPSPIDSFDNYSDIKDTIIAAKKITSGDILRVIPKISWTSGVIYEMYRHDYDRNNLSPVTNSTSLYSTRFYAMNSDFRVYECIYNGTTPTNIKGIVSLDEPTHTDLQPRLESDGYIWKYLFTIKPSDIIKFDSVDYIPVPANWETNTDVQSVRDAAVDGQIQHILIKDTSSASYQYTGLLQNVPIRGDGTGGLASVQFENGKPSQVTVTAGGSGYTFATLDLDSVVFGQGAEFNVIIPPPGGHGANIYNELGAFRVLVFSRIENSDSTNPDFPISNQFARIGIIKDPTVFGTSTPLTVASASGVYGLRLENASSLTPSSDGLVTQTIGAATTAVGKIISYDQQTQILRYWQDRSLATDTDSLGIPPYGYALNKFTATPEAGGNVNVTVATPTGSVTVGIETTFTGISTTVNAKTYYMGQSFVNGLANPEINKQSGEVIYIDNRPEVTRSANQREDIKIVLEF